MLMKFHNPEDEEIDDNKSKKLFFANLNYIDNKLGITQTRANEL